MNVWYKSHRMDPSLSPPPPPMVASMQNGPKFDLTFFLNLRPGIYPKSPDSLDL